jgi:hypothetical protein
MSNAQNTMTYPPINTLKSVTENVWVVDGPLIRFGMPWPKMPFPTRMTIIRNGQSDLYNHSPTHMTPDLKREIAAIGTPRWLIAPNRIHYWWMPDWKAAFPDAQAYLAPRIKEKAGDHIDFAHSNLEASNGYPWDAEITTLPVASSYMTEFVFFHRASRTLVLTDLIENFEGRKLPLWMRWLVRLAGSLDPDGGMPRDMRLSFAKNKQQLREAIETMIAWQPERIIMAHGRWYDRDGAAELRRAFGWLLD